ncbi:hypothetical protein B0H14DRAFT_3870202 [Mycena olivaceomarginata]|nr:hypothetical protein B0H14DRAFT_3870202 [Mycena olivaceomarginata]
MSGTRTRSPPNSNLGIAQPRPRPPSRQARMPEFGGGLFGDRSNSEGMRGFAGSESNSFQQSSQRQESYSSASGTTRKSEQASKTFESSEVTRVRRRRYTLADCELELELSILTIRPVEGSEFQFESTNFDLNDFVGNISGELVWGGGALQFTESCTGIRLENTFLVASCSRGRDEFVQARLNLDDHIAYISVRRCFQPITPDPAFAELMSSANWMNFTVITQPDMRSFLKNKAFQDAVSGVARRAVEEVMSQMQEQMMRAVEEAVKRVSEEAEDFVQSEMETLVKKATKTAAYTGLGQLKMMELEQRRAFNIFAPHITAPIIEEPEPDFI